MTSADWAREPSSEDERRRREVFLTYAVSVGTLGLTETLLLAVEARRAGGIGKDLAAAEAYAAGILRETLGDHQEAWAATALEYVEQHGLRPWSRARSARA